MIHPDLTNFIVAIVGASASFIGLLFVAISFVLDEEKADEVELTSKRMLAESSYAGLANIFFIGIVSLIPSINVGYIILLASLFGLFSTIHLQQNGKVSRAIGPFLIFSGVVYLFEMAFGIYSIAHGNAYYVSNYIFMTLVILLFSISLARAWELTGIRKREK